MDYIFIVAAGITFLTFIADALAVKFFATHNTILTKEWYSLVTKYIINVYYLYCIFLENLESLYKERKNSMPDILSTTLNIIEQVTVPSKYFLKFF